LREEQILKPLNNLTLAQRLLALVAVFVIGFAAYGALSLKTLAEIEVNGPVYQRIVQGKDLIADVLPPPAYILESYLTVLQLAQAKNSADQVQLLSRLQELKTAYDRRHAFWTQESLDKELATVFLKQAHEPAQVFFQIGFGEFKSAVIARDEVAMASSLERLSALYLKHREAIDLVVQMAEKSNLAAEAMARDRITAAYKVLLVMLVVCMATGIGIAVFIVRSMMKSLGAEPAKLGEVARTIAEGNLDFDITVAPGDKSSVLHQIERMRQQLQARMALQKAKQLSDARAMNAEALIQLAEQKSITEQAKREIYVSMTHAAQHVLNNLLNQLQLFKLAADRSSDFDRNTLKLFDGMTREASELITRLSSVTELNRQNIWDSVGPKA